MSIGFYPRFTWEGMRKNKQLYFPYTVTCSIMVMMFYIINSLRHFPLLVNMSGGGNIVEVLSLGRWVMGIFALIFLFYTNSFLVRRRKKEFGLYNILGMGKHNIAHIIFWEALLNGVASLVSGITFGIALSKFAELGLLNMLHAQIDYSFIISLQAILQSVELFTGIFVLIFFSTLLQVRRTDPLALLRSEQNGERPPKANWVLALVGAILLGAAYLLAVSIQSPLAALTLFFVAVIMVIVATYLLFISGSVAFCRILQKNKSYYYRSNHFVSISSMIYRMKRNGAGLASICILSTMVLVIISSTASLYIGAEDSIRTLYPRNIIAEVSLKSPEDLRDQNLDPFRAILQDIAQKNDVLPENGVDYRTASIIGTMQDGLFTADTSGMDALETLTYKNMYQLIFVPLSDYNRQMGTNETLAPDEALLFLPKKTFTEDSISVGSDQTFHIKEVVSEFPDSRTRSMQLVPSVFVIVSDLEDSVRSLQVLVDDNGNPLLELTWRGGFDMEAADATHIQIKKGILEGIRDLSLEVPEINKGINFYSCESAIAERDDFYATYGGLFFLGILLSIVFLFAAVLIIYYKQISEGFEDQARFGIMQKVGMTKRDIRKSINSQVLTVFFAPIVLAGLHLAFAFPLIWKILQLFNLRNVTLLIIVTICCYMTFALFYTLVYRMTSNVYYGIVSGRGQA